MMALWNNIEIPIKPSLVIQQMACLDFDETVIFTLKKKFHDGNPKEEQRFEK